MKFKNLYSFILFTKMNEIIDSKKNIKNVLNNILPENIIRQIIIKMITDKEIDEIGEQKILKIMKEILSYHQFFFSRCIKTTITKDIKKEIENEII